jgi:hypothetical protein
VNRATAAATRRDQRPDCKQICIGLVVTSEGLPVAYEVFAGNRADVTTLEDMVKLLKQDAEGRACALEIAQRTIGWKLRVQPSLNTSILEQIRNFSWQKAYFRANRAKVRLGAIAVDRRVVHRKVGYEERRGPEMARRRLMIREKEGGKVKRAGLSIQPGRKFECRAS